MKLPALNALAAAFIICLLAAFIPVPPARQGIEGTVYLVAGNQMPGPGISRPAPKGFKTTLYVYELTGMSQVAKKGEASFYSSIRTRLVKKILTNSKGRFTLQLPPGRYSLFTKKGPLFFANTFDDKNNIAPVEVLRNKMTKADVQVNYNAVY